MKKRQLKKIVSRITRATPARFRYNEQVKRAWVKKMDRMSPSHYFNRARPYHFDIDTRGNLIPCGLWRWAYLFEFQHKRRIVKQTEIEGCQVSTVFLGTNHGWGAGEPVTFESMIFGGPLDGEMERYRTKAEALAGHESLIARVLSPTPAPEVSS